MTRPVRFTPTASRDVEFAVKWYDLQRHGLGQHVLEELDRALAVLDAAPLAGPIVMRDVRRVLLHRFPYAAYYRVIEETIEVRAVLHLRRDVDRLMRGR